MHKIADYEIVAPIGEGGQSRYWSARPSPRLGLGDNTVAIKSISYAASESDFDRLADRLRLVASVSSPFLSTLYDVGQQGDLIYIASEYVPGGSLARPARPFSRVDVLRAIADSARGAHDLHEAGIAHRAIRPGNVLLAEQGAKLGDVAVTQLINPGQTINSAAQIGTIEHLSPELIQGQPPSRASDIWAIAVTMHKVLTGVSLHPGLPTDSLVTALRYLLDERPRLSDGLESGERRIIESCVALDPAERPKTGAELATIIDTEADRQAEQVHQ